MGDVKGSDRSDVLQPWPLRNLKGTWQNRKWLFSLVSWLDSRYPRPCCCDSPTLYSMIKPTTSFPVMEEGCFGGRWAHSVSPAQEMLKSRSRMASLLKPLALSAVLRCWVSQNIEASQWRMRINLSGLWEHSLLYSRRWINIYFKVNMKIGSICFLNAHSWFSSACFSKEEKHIYLHKSFSETRSATDMAFIFGWCHQCMFFEKRWAIQSIMGFFTPRWADYFDVELQISAQRRDK